MHAVCIEDRGETEKDTVSRDSTIERKIKENLSEYELSVLYEYEKGHSYADIAEKLKTKVKSVDTAIQRIRKKANKIKDVEYYKIKESIDS